MPTRAGDSASGPRIRFNQARPNDATGAQPETPELLISHGAFEKGQIRFEIPDAALAAVIKEKQEAFTRIYRTLDVIHADLDGFFSKVAEPLPARVEGILLNPDGTPAEHVSVEVPAPDFSSAEIEADGRLRDLRWGTPRDLTDARGGFSIQLPSAPAPAAGLALRIRGAGATAELRVRRVELLDVKLGSLVLPRPIPPLPTSVLARLKAIQSDIVAGSEEDVLDNLNAFAAPGPQIMLGEGDCARFFRSGSGVIDRFRYAVMIRLVEPQMNQWRPTYRIAGSDQSYLPFPIPDAHDSFWSATGVNNAMGQLQGLGNLVLVNRSPIASPIDVTAFHRQIERAPVQLPKASTLGLGYVVGMRQTWIPAGLSLGDLVYSLPLAPGEQQRIAIQETRQSASEREMEAMSEEERQTFTETEDASALATFQSAFNEAAAGGSRMESESSTASGAATAHTGIVGAILGGGGVSAGYSNSSSSGSTSSWQNTSRDFTSSSAQEMHSALTRVAAASRRSTRTRIRVASAMERTQVTTRVVTNNNRNHALTMQWWQVLRHYNVSSEVDDVQLVCFVPFELVPFLPMGHPTSLGSVQTRTTLLARYDMVLRYHDVIEPFFRRHAAHRYGLRQLREFAANPEMQPAASDMEQEVVTFTLRGTFMPFEDVYVTAVGRSGARVGPIRLTPQGANGTVNLTAGAYRSRGELLGHLKSRRLSGGDTVLRASIPLPAGLGRSDVVRFDVTRRFTSLSYQLGFPDLSDMSATAWARFIQQTNVSLSPSELEDELGGPVVRTAAATLPGGVSFLGSESFSSGEQMGARLPIPTARVAPILSFADLLRIEAMFQHVVRNTVTYSRAVWASLTSEERAILLERFTIGVPEGGVTGPDQEVPLLNCVTNRILGFFGNAAIMPFAIPASVAEKMEVTSRDIQDALLRFHRQGFQPTRSAITLPARGTLGEAVLGGCNSSEKIDLTRFWNWQDSPIPQADPIPAGALEPARALVDFVGAGAGAGGGGTGGAGSGAGSSGSIISINSPGSGGSRTALAEALVAGAPDLARELDMTGLQTLQKQIQADTESAAAGRKEAIDSVTQIQVQAMKSAEKVVEAVADAAASILGGGGGGSGGSGGSGDSGGSGGNGGSGGDGGGGS
jgi:hypothetical protein